MKHAWLRIWVIAALVAITPIVSSFLLNVSETSVTDIWPPIALNILVATLIVAACSWVIRNHPLRGYVLVASLTFLATSALQSGFGGVVNTVVNWLPWQVYLPAAIYGTAAVFLIAGYPLASWADRVAQRWHRPEGELIRILDVGIVASFLWVAIPATIAIVQAWPQYSYRPPALATTTNQAAAKPDIYYILLEDYTNQTVLKNQMGFDNSGFISFLNTQGFYTVPDAKSNYPYTVNSVASTFSADYLSDVVDQFGASANQTLVPYFQTVKNSPVISQLKSLGYTYHLLGDWYETSNSSPQADHVYTDDGQLVLFNHRFSLNDFDDTQVRQNILWPLIQRGLSLGSFKLLGYHTQTDADLIQSQLKQLRGLAAQPAGGRFIFTQILAPHNYFLYNADGSKNPNPDPNNAGEPATVKYTNEIQYINSQIQPIIAQIMKNSGGKANIILQSDEGAPELLMANATGTPAGEAATDDMARLSPATLQMKFGILASYYIPGASASDLAAGADPVNIFRLLLNTNFGSSMPYLPACYYGFPQGENESFVYENLNAALLGSANSQCPANGNFINPGPTQLVTHPRTSAAGGDDD